MKGIVFAVAATVLSLGPNSAAVAQDVKAGEAIFAQCRACHQVGPKARNLVGPKLNGLFGRAAGTIEGYNYSEANKKSGITWDEKTFAEYIANPRAKVPGTKMAYAGLKDPKRIENLIAFLKQYDRDGNPAKPSDAKPADVKPAEPASSDVKPADKN